MGRVGRGHGLSVAGDYFRGPEGGTMSFTAYFQADDELRHTIATCHFEHTAEFERDEFIKRMTHPHIGIWFTWIERRDDV